MAVIMASENPRLARKLNLQILMIHLMVRHSNSPRSVRGLRNLVENRLNTGNVFYSRKSQLSRHLPRVEPIGVSHGLKRPGGVFRGCAACLHSNAVVRWERVKNHIW